MKAEALNCPNCGAAVADRSVNCSHCRSRLKTMSCSSCFGTIFEGSRFCPLCGEKAVAAGLLDEDDPGDCPRCGVHLDILRIGEVALAGCRRCEGIWADIDTFETVCADREKQSAVLKRFKEIHVTPRAEKVRYMPCPSCGVLMNRNNFAKVSGVIIDTCREHGVWFDAEELPRIVEFIRQGGMEYSRQKEMARIEAEREKLRTEKFKFAVDRFRNEPASGRRPGNSGRPVRETVREFIDYLIG